MTTALILDVIRVPSAFLNGASGVSIVCQVLPAMPGVGSWESTKLVPYVQGVRLREASLHVVSSRC